MPKEKQYIMYNKKWYALKKSKFCTNKSIVHVSDSMSGKMTDIPSISTSCLKNPICLARMQSGDSICSHCFAKSTIRHYSALGAALDSNYEILTETVLPFDMLPKFKSTVEIVRIESFGDVGNITQAINYANIARNNPHVIFAWWSKNMPIIKTAFEKSGGKPSNVIMVESSPKLNVEKDVSCDIVDKVFTVYDDEHIEKDNVDINCGARDCNTCRRCYKKSTEKSVKERLK